MPKAVRLLRWWLVAAALFTAAAHAPGQMPATPAPADWKPLFQGIDYVNQVVSTPRPLVGHTLRIDLRTRGVSFLATPGSGLAGSHTIGKVTSRFLREHRLQAAINAAPFGPVYSAELKPMSIVALTVSRGRMVSPATDLPALLISRRNRARIAEPPFDLRDVYTAVGGFGVVLRGGTVGGSGPPLHPRTAAGISQDGRYLFLLVVDGRQSGYSEGITTAEVGEWLKNLGAADGINLDGGGTSTLVVEGDGRKPVVLNRPIHAGIPGNERPSASHLGIRARRLPK